MNIKVTKLSTSLILTMGLSVPFLASAEGEKAAMPATTDGVAEVVECVTQADIDTMSDADKAKLTTRVCTDEEAAAKAAAEAAETPKAAQ